MMQVSELIARLEAANGPDRALDEAIFELITGRKRHISTFEQYDPSERLPRYTESIDDALTLVPEGMWAEGTLSKSAYIEVHDNEHYDAVGIGRGAPPALALCIAALKARA